MSSPTIVAAVSEPLMAEFFAAGDLARLRETADALGEGIGGFERVDHLSDCPDLSAARVAITSWGAPPFDAALLARMPRLELIAHTGASIRPFVTDDLFDRGVQVTQAGQGMARSVAEVSLTFTLALLHQVPQLHEGLRSRGHWGTAGVQHEILGAPIAVVGASRTGRAYLELVRALGAEALLVDPTLTTADAAALGARLMPLEDALRAAQIVALHAPSLPETRHLIGRDELALMRDGAGLVNTARSWLVDEAALLAELERGRLCAALDVFDDEPLPADSPFLAAPGVLLTPHRAAGTRQGRLRQGRIVADEISAFAAGRPLQHTVTAAQLATMA